MSKVLIDRELLERAVYRLELVYDADAPIVCDLSSVLSAPSGTPAMPVKAYYHEAPNEYGGLNKSVGLEVRKEFADVPLVLESDALARIAEIEADRDSHQRYVMLTNLLARIHRDGGQYMKQHGMDKAFADADAIVAELYAAPVSEAKAKGVVQWPDADEIMQMAFEEGQPAACRVAVENCEVFRARIAELESRYQRDVYGLNNEGDPIGGDPAGGYANDNARLRAELAAIKAQEPIGWYTEDHLDDKSATTYSWTVAERWVEKGWPVSPLYAAPVSEAKAQGVVMPERDAVIRKAVGMCNRIPGSTTWNAAEFAYDELAARLNAAPVQQVSVPASAFASRAITHYEAALLAAFPSGSSGEVFNQWNEARRVLAAAPAAPAADAGDVLEQAMYTLISIGYHENSGLVHELRQALAAHRSTGVV